MRIRSRLARLLIWGMVLVSSILAGGLWFAFSYLTDSETVKKVIRTHAKRYLPSSILEMGKVDLHILGGDITLRRISLKQTIDGEPFPTISIPWLQVKLNPRKVLNGEFESCASEVIVSQPTLQICRRKDGTWNIQGLLADPWPGPAIKDPPPIIIKNGTVELMVQHDPESSATTSKANRTASTEPPPLEQPGRSDEPIQPLAAKKVAILREVNLTIRSTGSSSPELAFDGTAEGDSFEKIELTGTIDPTTGKISFRGDLSRLTISEILLERIPREVRSAAAALGLKQGEVTLSVGHVTYDPKAPADQRLDYEMTAWLNAGQWECKNLPFPINEMTARLKIRNGDLTIDHAEGRNGMTTVRIVQGALKLGDPATMPFDFRIDLLDLMLDQRLKDQTPPQFKELWEVFKPTGKIDTAIRVVRETPGGMVGVGATVVCRDVSGIYRHFPYPIEHMSGKLVLERGSISLKLESLVGGKPIVLAGTIDNPGPDAIVKLNIEAESVPVDQTLLNAIPPHVRKVVNQFKPSGSAKATVKILRKPTVGPMVRAEGNLELDAVIDLKEQCSICWQGLPYPVRNLTGRLIIRPDLWQFENMRGDNGQSLITASGQVRKLPLPRRPNGEEPLKVDVVVKARNLLFNDELRDALQPVWRKTWNTINPTGSTDVDAVVNVEHGRPDSVHIEIKPRPKSNIRLVVPTLDPNFTPELPMEDVNGLFVFQNSVVTMRGTDFKFRGAPVSFESGTVTVEDNGKFALAVANLWVKQIRLDSGFRKIMPPRLASVAARLDDGRTFSASGDLEIGWSGVPNQPAWCRWKNTKAFFNDNALKAGIPLEHIQGEIEQVSGWSDGKALEVSGRLNLASVNFLGQQITGLESRFSVDSTHAQMDEIRGSLLGGQVSGNCWISLDSPTAARYGTSILLQNAALEQYGLTVPGRQSYRGQLNAGLNIAGLGTSIRSLRGDGWANVTQGDLGELPVVFQFAKFFNEKLFTSRPRSTPKTAFDEAEVKFQIHDGVTTLSPINFIGNAFRLVGEGTLDPQGNLDIGLRVRYGRGSIRIPILSDALNEASREIVGVRVQGTAWNPTFEIQPLPALLQGLGRNRGASNSEKNDSGRAIRR